jgi:RNA polymerase sigma-70 factor (sigma-E family)
MTDGRVASSSAGDQRDRFELTRPLRLKTSARGVLLEKQKKAKSSPMTEDEEFAEFANRHAERLRTTAFVLCRDWHLAQDLTQTALTKLFLSWRRAVRADNLMAYAQKILLRTYLDHRRRRSSSEAVTAVLHGQAYRQNSELRLTMIDALGRLPARDRAIVVLRYFEDQSVEQVADALKLPVSVVKSQTQRSLTKLRQLLAPDQLSLFQD